MLYLKNSWVCEMYERKDALIHRPQINISFSASKRMWFVFSCALLCIIQSALNDSGSSLMIAFAALAAALTAELLLTWKKNRFKKIKDGSAAATAMVLALLLPNQIHPMYASFGALFAIIIVKYSFGGLGSNWLNPALGGWLFIRFSWPGVFNRALEASVSGVVGAASAPDIALTSFLNRTIFSLTGAELPFGYFDLLFITNTGIIADRGLFALLIGSAVLIALRISRFYIPVIFLFVFGFLTRFLGDIPFGGQFWNGDILHGFFSGGTIAAAFILAAEPSSGAKTMYGVMAATIIGAILAWVFRYPAQEFSGAFIAIALVNCLMPLIRLLEGKLFFRGKTVSLQESA